jgi:fumarylacetoacetase
MIDPTNPEKGIKYSLTRLLDFELEVALVVGRCMII